MLTLSRYCQTRPRLLPYRSRHRSADLPLPLLLYRGALCLVPFGLGTYRSNHEGNLEELRLVLHIAVTRIDITSENAWTCHLIVFGSSLLFSFFDVLIADMIWIWTLLKGKMRLPTVLNASL